MATDVLARLSVLIDAQTKQFGVALNGLNTQLNKFGATVNAQATSISNFEKRIATIQRSLGSLGIAFGAFQIANVVQDSIRRVAEFEHQMKEVQAITGATAQDFARLRDDALKLGAATKFTATEIAQLQTEFGRLGFTTDEILAATEATVQLAVATGEDLARSADVAGSTVRAFGLQAEQTQRVVDVMAESFNRTALGLDNFAESIKFVAPVARAANLSIEETTALLGVLADAGIRGSNAGTALRRIITDLAKDGRPLVDRLKELSAQGLDLGGAMDEVGRNAQTALLVLTSNVDRIGELTQGLKNAEGAAAATAKIMRDDLTGDVEALTSAWDGLILSFSEGSGVIRQFIQDITSVVNILTDISNFVQGTGSDLSKLFKFIWDAGPIGATNKAIREALGLYRDYKSVLEETKKATKDLRDEEKKRAIESTVNAALASENVEAYIRALDQNIYKEEIIAEIRRRQAEALKGQSGAISEQIGIIEALEAREKELGDAIKKATSISEIHQLKHELEGVQIRIDSIINPSTPPKPIKIPIEFNDNILFDEIEEFQRKFGIALPVTIDPDFTRLLESINAVVPTEGIVIPVAVEFLESADEDFQKRMQKLKETVEGTAIDISSLLAGATTSIAEALGAATATGFENFGQDILRIVAGFAKQFGELLIASGFAALSLRVLIKNPFTAIAAGAALVALASSVQATANRAAKTAFSGGAATGSDRATTQFARERAGEQIVFAQGEFKVRGTDLVLVLDNTARKMQRTG